MRETVCVAVEVSVDEKVAPCVPVVVIEFDGPCDEDDDGVCIWLEESEDEADAVRD